MPHHSPEAGTGEVEKGERALEEMECGEVLPDISAPSWPCRRPDAKRSADASAMHTMPSRYAAMTIQSCC